MSNNEYYKWLELIKECKEMEITVSEARRLINLHREPKNLVQRIYHDRKLLNKKKWSNV